MRALKCRLYYLFADCSWEWRGDSQEHTSGHDMSQGAIREYQEEAERVLALILHIEGFYGRKALKEARLECKRLEQEGWTM